MSINTVVEGDKDIDDKLLLDAQLYDNTLTKSKSRESSNNIAVQ